MSSAFGLQVRLALRNVRRNPRRSLFTAAAISFGLFCVIVFQALKVGLHQEMVAGTVRLDTGAVQVHAAGYQPGMTTLKPLPEPQTVLEALRREGVTAVSRRLKVPAMLFAGTKSSTVLLAGVDPAAEPRVTEIADKVTAGSFLADGEGVLLGGALAESLGVGPGDRVTLMAQGLFGRPVSRPFAVAGIYRTGVSSFDRSHVYLPLPAAQSFLQADDLVSEIVASVPPEAAAALAGRLRAALPGGSYQVRSWQQLAPDLVQLLELNDATMRLLILIVFAIAALGIANTMTMITFERFRELGILAALGLRPGGIVRLIALESLCLGVIAAVLGSLLGIGVCNWLGQHGLDLTRFTSANQYFAAGHVIRAHLLPGDLAAANLLTLATALLAGLYPAWKAARLDPVQAIRHQ